MLRPRLGRPPSPSRTKPVELKECSRHGVVEFGLYGVARPRWRCKRCIGEAVRRRQHRIKRTLVAEAGGRCVACGYERCIANLHFHHLDPAGKSFALSMATGKSLATYRAEAAKCILVCANCHGEIEAGMVDLSAILRV